MVQNQYAAQYNPYAQQFPGYPPQQQGGFPGGPSSYVGGFPQGGQMPPDTYAAGIGAPAGPGQGVYQHESGGFADTNDLSDPGGGILSKTTNFILSLKGLVTITVGTLLGIALYKLRPGSAKAAATKVEEAVANAAEAAAPKVEPAAANAAEAAAPKVEPAAANAAEAAATQQAGAAAPPAEAAAAQQAGAAAERAGTTAATHQTPPAGAAAAQQAGETAEAAPASTNTSEAPKAPEAVKKAVTELPENIQKAVETNFEQFHGHSVQETKRTPHAFLEALKKKSTKKELDAYKEELDKAFEGLTDLQDAHQGAIDGFKNARHNAIATKRKALGKKPKNQPTPTIMNNLNAGLFQADKAYQNQFLAALTPQAGS